MLIGRLPLAVTKDWWSKVDIELSVRVSKAFKVFKGYFLDLRYVEELALLISLHNFTAIEEEVKVVTEGLLEPNEEI